MPQDMKHEGEVSVWIKKESLERLEQIADALGVTVEELTDEAVQGYVEEALRFLKRTKPKPNPE
jgi:hypothetical protein